MLPHGAHACSANEQAISFFQRHIALLFTEDPPGRRQ